MIPTWRELLARIRILCVYRYRHSAFRRWQRRRFARRRAAARPPFDRYRVFGAPIATPIPDGGYEGVPSARAERAPRWIRVLAPIRARGRSTVDRQNEIEGSMNAEELRALLLSFIASLTLADHMGDVSSDVTTVLERLGLEIQWDEWHELGAVLHRMGVKTLHGTDLGTEDDDDEPA